MNKGYIKIPRELFSHPAFLGARLKHQQIFLWLITHATYKDADFDDHGVWLHLKPGQYAFSRKKLADQMNEEKKTANSKIKESELITEADVRGCINYFEKCVFLTRVVTNQKTIVTLTFPGSYETFKTNSNQGSNQDLTRHSPIKKESNKDKEKDIPNGISKRKTAEPLSAQPQKISYREFVQLTEGEHGKLSQELGTETLEEYLDILNAHKAANGKKYKSDYHTMVKGGWVRKAHQERLERSPKVENKRITFEEARKERVRQLFRHGEFYNGAECILSDGAISFTRGMTHYEIKFKEYGFEDQFESILRKLHIPMQKHV